MGGLSDLKNKYEGERAIIIGNGPSLSETPLEEMDSEHTFAVNKINLLYEEREFRPSYYFTSIMPHEDRAPPIEDKENPIKTHVDMGIPCILPDVYEPMLGERQNIHYFNKFRLLVDSCPFHQMTVQEVREANIGHLKEYWSDDVENLIYFYHTIYGLTQLVLYMGFDEIVYVGTDLGMEYVAPHMIFESGMDPHRFDGTRTGFLKEAWRADDTIKSMINAIALQAIHCDPVRRNIEELVESANSSHFAPDYKPTLRVEDGEKANQELRKSHLAIRRICNDKGVDTYNGTVGGELEIHPRIEIRSIL